MCPYNTVIENQKHVREPRQDGQTRTQQTEFHLTTADPCTKHTVDGIKHTAH